MKSYYISSQYGNSGVTRYSHDFYRLVLKPRQYEFVNSDENIVNILSAISSRDRVHIEISIFQKKEVEILFRMLKAGYKHVSVTIHDAPLIKYPFYEFKNPLLNKISKFYDKFFNSLGAITPEVKRIRSIYVLSHAGLEKVKSRYGVDHVYYLPHVMDLSDWEDHETNNCHFIYFGFIGKNKGVEYALKLHREVMEVKPGAKFFIVGEAMGKEKDFYAFLKKTYTKNVFYLGYVPDDALKQIFDSATFALLPFTEYKFFSPVSGSVLYCLKRGKVVLTRKVNAVGEIIQDGKNGVYLTGDLHIDKRIVTQIMEDQSAIKMIRNEAYQFLKARHSPEVVNEAFDRINLVGRAMEDRQ